MKKHFLKLLLSLLYLNSWIDINILISPTVIVNWMSNQRLINKGLLKISIIEPKYQYNSYTNMLKILWNGGFPFTKTYPKSENFINETLIVEMKEVSKDIYSHEEKIFKFTNKFKLFMAFIVSIFYFTSLSQVNVWNIYDVQVYYGYLIFLVSIFFSIDYLYYNDGAIPIPVEMVDVILKNFSSDKHDLIKELILLINSHSKK